MNDDNPEDVGAAISHRMHREGEVPAGGMVTEVDYILLARVRVLHADGTQDTVWPAYHSDRVDEAAHEGMAMKMLRKAQARSASWG